MHMKKVINDFSHPMRVLSEISGDKISIALQPLGFKSHVTYLGRS